MLKKIGIKFQTLICSSLWAKIGSNSEIKKFCSLAWLHCIYTYTFGAHIHTCTCMNNIVLALAMYTCTYEGLTYISEYYTHVCACYWPIITHNIIHVGDFHFLWECLRVVFSMFWGVPSQDGSLSNLRSIIRWRNVDEKVKVFNVGDEFLMHAFQAHLTTAIMKQLKRWKSICSIWSSLLISMASKWSWEASKRSIDTYREYWPY